MLKEFLFILVALQRCHESVHANILSPVPEKHFQHSICADA